MKFNLIQTLVNTQQNSPKAITTNVVSSNPAQARCTPHNIM